jgi:hypothetical protein
MEVDLWAMRQDAWNAVNVTARIGAFRSAVVKIDVRMRKMEV